MTFMDRKYMSTLKLPKEYSLDGNDGWYIDMLMSQPMNLPISQVWGRTLRTVTTMKTAYTSPGKTHLNWTPTAGMDYFAFAKEYCIPKKELEVGDTDGIIELHDSVLKAVNCTIELWKKLLAVTNSNISTVRINERYYQECVEYFIIDGRKYTVKFNQTSINIESAPGNSWSNSDYITLHRACSPDYSKNNYSMYDTSESRFYKSKSNDYEYGSSYISGKRERYPLVLLDSREDMEAYIFQDSLVQDNVYSTLANVIASTLETRTEYQFETMSVSLEQVQMGFVPVLSMMCMEQDARMKEYRDSLFDISTAVKRVSQ